MEKARGSPCRPGGGAHLRGRTTPRVLFLSIFILQLGQRICEAKDLESGDLGSLSVEACYADGDSVGAYDFFSSCSESGCTAGDPPAAYSQSDFQGFCPNHQEESAKQGAYRSLESITPPPSPLPLQGGQDLGMVIQPSYLDWKESPLCSAKVSNISVQNTQKDRSLWITSLSTDNIQFHPQGFEKLEVSPGDTAELTVGYLPRTLGPVDATLVIQTTQGSFLLPMHGQGIHSPYGVTPLNGAKVPSGLQYTYQLILKNPHDTNLQVNAIYTEEEFLRLTLPPEAGSDHPQRTKGVKGDLPFWQLAPQEEKGVILLEFISLVQGKFRGIVTLATDHGTLMVPVEITAISGGVHASTEELDFGTLTYPEEHHRIPVTLLNMGPHPVELLDVYSSTSDPLLGIQFKKGVTLDIGTERTVAAVTYVGTGQGRFSGKLYFHTNETSEGLEGDKSGGKKVELPYRARVVHGSLRYHTDNSTFEARKGRTVTRDLTLTNHFSLPVVLYSATISDPSFQLEAFPVGHVLSASGGVSPPLRLKFSSNSSDLSFSTQMLVTTNVTMLSIPLLVYHGRLQYGVPTHGGHSAPGRSGPDASLDEVPAFSTPTTTESEKSASMHAIDFGVLGVNEARARNFNVTNPNPVAIQISSISASLPEATLRLESLHYASGTPVPMGPLATRTVSSGSGLKVLDPEEVVAEKGRAAKGKQGKELASVSDDGSVAGLSLELGPGYTAVFAVELSVEEEQKGTGEIIVVTPKERHSIPLLFTSLTGSLSIAPAIVRFENCFPGLVRSAPLMARSTYGRPLVVTAVTTSDPHLRLVLANTTIPPNKRVHLGMLEFDAAGARGDNRLLPADSFDQMDAMNAALSGQLAKGDAQAIKAWETAWEALVEKTKGEVRSVVTIHTDVVAGYTLNVRAGLARPSILASPSLNFSLVEVGKSSLGVVQITNPCSQPLSVALLEPVPPPPPRGLGADGSSGFLQLPLSGEAWPCQACTVEQGSDLPGDCEPCRLAGFLRPEPPMPRLPFRMPPGAVRAAVVQPLGTLTLGPVEFAPHSHLSQANAILRVRNNLTVLEELMLTGRGGSGAFDFLLGREDAEDGSLSISIDVHKLGLRRLTSKTGEPTGRLGTKPDVPLLWPVTLRKKFTAINSGNMPIDVLNLGLLPFEDHPSRASPSCQLGGFELLSCGSDGSFAIDSAAQAEVWVSYRPDLATLSSRCYLVVETSAGQLRYSLEAKMPAEALSVIHDALALDPLKGSWRATIILTSLSLGLFALGCVVYELREEIGQAVLTNPNLSPETTWIEEASIHLANLPRPPPPTAATSAAPPPQPPPLARHPSMKKAPPSELPRRTSSTGASSIDSTSNLTGEFHEAKSSRRRRRKKEQEDVAQEPAAPEQPQALKQTCEIEPVISEAAAKASKSSAVPPATPALAPATPLLGPEDGSIADRRAVNLSKEDAAAGVSVSSLSSAAEEEASSVAAPMPHAIAPKKQQGTTRPAQDVADELQLGSTGSMPDSTICDLSVSHDAELELGSDAPSTPSTDQPTSSEQSIAQSPDLMSQQTEFPARKAKALTSPPWAGKPPVPPQAVDTTALPPTSLKARRQQSKAAKEQEKPSAPAASPPKTLAPGSKRMAHAALLTPLETSTAELNLGVILPARASGKGQKGRLVAAEPCAQSAQLDLAASPSPSPYPEASPGNGTGTPKSARRRRRPRRGGGGHSQPPTPGSAPSEGPQVAEGCAPRAKVSLDFGQSSAASDLPLPPQWQVSGASGMQGMRFLDTVFSGGQQLSGMPAGNTYDIAASTPVAGVGTAGASLDQLGAAAGVPDSLYSIWGGPPSVQDSNPVQQGGDLGGSLFSTFPAAGQQPYSAPSQQAFAAFGSSTQPGSMPLHELLGDDFSMFTGDSGVGGFSTFGSSAFGGFSVFGGGGGRAENVSIFASPEQQSSSPFSSLWAAPDDDMDMGDSEPEPDWAADNIPDENVLHLK